MNIDISPLEQIIRERIAQRGSITVAEFMEYALSHEKYGYYMSRDPFGEHGDFTTAPEISQIFGEMVGVWLAAMWQMLGRGDMVLLELGPGRGTLLADALRATRHVADFHDSLVIVMVESSQLLRRYQRATLSAHHPRISWLPHIEQNNLDELPNLPMLMVANEFFDALPIRQYVKTPTGLQERVVIIDEASNKLAFTMQPMGVQLVKGGKHVVADADDSVIIESCPLARQIAGGIGAHMARYGGAGLVIDYGYTGASRGNTLQAVKQHGFWQPLQAAGEADLTAHVAFDDLAAAFKDSKLQTSITTQGAFLPTIGGAMRLHDLLEHASDEQAQTLISGYERLVDAGQMGDLFKLLGVCNDGEINMAGFPHEH